MKVTLPHIIRSSVIGTIVILALLFIPAGTLTYWQGWAYVATFIVCSLAYTVYLAKHDPALLRRRIEAGISHEKEPAQKVIMFFLYVSFGALIIVPPLVAPLPRRPFDLHKAYVFRLTAFASGQPSESKWNVNVKFRPLPRPALCAPSLPGPFSPQVS